jgi:hypothetical protein
LCKFGVVFTAFHTSVATGHDDEFTDGTAFYASTTLSAKALTWLCANPPMNFTVFYGFGCFATFGMGNDF